MKKIFLLLFALVLINQTSKAQSPCAYTSTVNGNTINLNWIWAIVGINVIDSVNINWGDGTSVTLIPPNGGPISHTFTTGGTYNVCLNRYMSILGVPNSTVICTYCQTFIISTPPPTGCISNANFTTTSTGNTATFNNTSTCAGCSTNTSIWNFGDGSALNTSNSPTYTYASPGTYTVCLVYTGVDSSGNTCIDSNCQTITITPPPVTCNISAGFSNTNTGANVAFTNTTTCTNCASTTYLWTFGDISAPSTQASPTHTYNTSGTYNVCLVTTGLSATSSICLDTICKTISIVTALKDFQKNNLVVYPNPSHDVLYMSKPNMSNNGIVKILDIAGRIISQENINNHQKTEIAIPVSNLTKGIYFVEFSTEGKSYIARFSKD